MSGLPTFDDDELSFLNDDEGVTVSFTRKVESQKTSAEIADRMIKKRGPVPLTSPQKSKEALTIFQIEKIYAKEVIEDARKRGWDDMVESSRKRAKSEIVAMLKKDENLQEEATTEAGKELEKSLEEPVREELYNQLKDDPELKKQARELAKGKLREEPTREMMENARIAMKGDFKQDDSLKAEVKVALRGAWAAEIKQETKTKEHVTSIVREELRKNFLDSQDLKAEVERQLEDQWTTEIRANTSQDELRKTARKELKAIFMEDRRLIGEVKEQLEKDIRANPKTQTELQRIIREELREKLKEGLGKQAVRELEEAIRGNEATKAEMRRVAREELKAEYKATFNVCSLM